MRAPALVCLLLTLAAPAMAEDRFGPQTHVAPAAAMDAPAARLSWPGKVAPTAPDAAANSNMAPARLADGVLRRTSMYAAAPAAPALPPAPAMVASAAPAPVENAPWKRLTGTSTPLPTAAPAAMEEAAPPASPATPVAEAATLTAAQPASAPQPAAAPGEQARYYSLHREYGETPDAIAPPPKSQVFLAGGPLTAGVGGADEDIARAEGDGTGRTAALNKARLAADWKSSSAK